MRLLTCNFLLICSILHLGIQPLQSMQSFANQLRAKAFSSFSSLQMISHISASKINSLFGPNGRGDGYRNKFNSHSPQPTWSWISPLFVAALLNPDEKKSDQRRILNDRPPLIKEQIDRTFEYAKTAHPGSWLYNGGDYYSSLELDEDKLLPYLAVKSRWKKDIYIIDIGCASGKWGKNTMNVLLQNEACQQSGKRFHIISITGGFECDETILKNKYVTLYQFNQFKIENLDEELLKRGFDLKDKVDLIVSSWTLRHLVDPFGTLKQMYRLLTPQQGMLMSNGFWFMFDDSKKVQSFPRGNPNILAHTNATILFYNITACRDLHQFLLVRNNKDELTIPLEYTGRLGKAGRGYQNESYHATIFKRTPLFKPDFTPEYIKADTCDSYLGFYCDKDDQRCKDLYVHLKRQKLFTEYITEQQQIEINDMQEANDGENPRIFEVLSF